MGWSETTKRIMDQPQYMFTYEEEKPMGGLDGQTIPLMKDVVRDISIRKVENGYIVTIGCKTFVCEDIERMLAGIKLYLEKPNEAEAKYCPQNVPTNEKG